MKAARMLGIVGVAMGLVLGVLARPAAAGTTWHVDANGFADFNSIQAALDDPCTVDGDEIEVAPGTYYEAIDFNDKAVRLYSSGGADVTTIDANGAYHAVQCVSGEDANTILEGFTITGGDANGLDPNERCGGGMYNNGSSPTVTNCTFSGNTADANGGGMYNGSGSSPTVTNCIFSDNMWVLYGGGMFNDDSSPVVTNCTFYENSAFLGGDGMYNQNYSSPTVTNCILWGDITDSIGDDMTGSASVTYSDVAVEEGVYPGTGNINAEPGFVNAGGGDLRLVSSASPCVDSGNNSVVTEPNDLAGNPRVADGDLNSTATVDMGAYELQSKDIHNITQDAYYETIQAAIDYASNGHQVEVGAGTYNEAIDFKGKAITLRSTDPNDPNIVAATVIDASGLGSPVVICNSGEGPNTILAGFTITGGSATNSGGMHNYNSSSPTVTNCTFSGNSAASCGGGMFNDNESSPTVTNCTFSGNTAAYGGGMHNYSSSPTVTNCTFSGNTAAYGGGICNGVNSSPTVTNCTFSGNTATSQYGGGMFNDWSNPTVTNCTFSENSAYIDGGGMYNMYSTLTVTNCTLSGNSAASSGGGMYNYGSSPTVTNCTFSGNTAEYVGGGICNSVNSSPTVTNCILWGNSLEQIIDYDYPSSSAVVTYSDVEGGTGEGWFGTGCIDADPCFVDADANDFRLLYWSACVDAGDNNSVPADTADLDGDGNTAEAIPFDLDGVARVLDGDWDGSAVVDMGAYECWRLDAYDPNPADGAEHVRKDPTLTWTPGAHADRHEVYFGTDETAVANADSSDTAGIYRETQDANSYTPGTLVLGTYYWKITEVNDGYVGPRTPPWEGEVWSFRVEGHAYDPNPADGAELVTKNPTLTWKPGAHAATTLGHEVYFGTDYDDVNEATTASWEYMGLYTPNSYTPAGPLVLGKTYYWKITEVNDGYVGPFAPPWEGDVWSFRVEGHAYDPSPGDGEVNVPFLGTVLSWTAGAETTSHDVYFGTDAQAVEDATTSSAEYRQNQSAGYESYWPGALNVNKRYYWRIDERSSVHPSGLKGDVWSFTTVEFLVVDDFDSYANPTELTSVWKDYLVNGTGALVDVETDANFTEDGNSMFYEYMNNDWPYYSEAYADTGDLGVTSNWTHSGLAALALSFLGKAGNALDDMYVALTDGSNRTGKVVYPDVNDLGGTEFTEWNIGLSEFVAANSVDITDVNRITIGFGDKTLGGSGTVWFDNIRLYPRRCLPEISYAAGDLTGEDGEPDCVVDGRDLKIIAEQWLTSGPEADIVDDDIVNFEDYGMLGDNWLEEFLWPPE